MRLVFEPAVGSTNLFGESDFLRYVTLAKEASSKHFIWFIVPDVGKPAEEMREYLESISSNIRVLVADTFREGLYYNEAHIMPDFDRYFHPNYGRYPVDAVITSKSSIAAYEARVLKDVRYEWLVPVVILEPECFYPEFDDEYMTEIVRSRVYGYGSCYTIFSTKNELDLALKLCRRFLSFSTIKEIMEKRSTIISTGINCAEIDKLIAGVDKSDKLTMFFGGRLNNTKHIDVVLQEFQDLFSFARDVDFKMTSPRIGQAMDLEPYKKFIDIQLGVRREEFLRKSASGHILFYPSPHEGFPAGVWEQIYTGLIPVVRRCKWTQAQMPEDYPFFFDSVVKAKAIIRYILDDYPGALAKAGYIKDYAKEHYDSARTNQQILDYVWDICYGDEANNLGKPYLRAGMGRKNRELVRDAVDLIAREEFSFEDLTGAVEQLRPGYRLWYDRPKRVGKFTKTMLYQYMLDCGWSDRCDSEYPRFYKKEGAVIDYGISDSEMAPMEETGIDEPDTERY